MVLSAFLLASVAVAVCAVGIGFTLRFLGLGFVPTLMWLGVLEVPPPPVSRRRRREY